MTTIAFKDNVLVADSLSTAGWNRRGTFEKIRTHHGALYAGCGSVDCVVQFFEWAETGEPRGFKFAGKADDFAGLIVRFANDVPDVFTVEESFKPWRVTMPFVARGSGSEYALGAMVMGADALEACRVAAKFDLGTGAPFQIIRRVDGRFLEEAAQ